mmetsp:Transcript_33583/g.83911  ORF Transcript_33583/g.83911 Transcript_33583/m.83911 type:complete len:245 (-) Transcript_33583:235-969(-)
MISALVLEKPTRARVPPPPLATFFLAPEVSSSAYEPSARSRPVRQKHAATRCMTMGMMKHIRQDQSTASPTLAGSSEPYEPCAERKASMICGMTSSVTPPPTLPQPPAVALTVPTMRRSKNWEHQTWQVTNVARERPIMKRPRMKLAAPCAVIRTTMPGIPSISSRIIVLRAPHMSHIGPARTRMITVPLTARLPASESWSLLRSRPPSIFGFLRYGPSDAGAKTEKKVQKNPKVAAQNTRMCG